MHPATPEMALVSTHVPPENVYRDVGGSGSRGTASRDGWQALDAKLQAGDALVVAAVDRVGRKWVDVAAVLRDLRRGHVRVRSLAASEAGWVHHLFAPDGSAEALIGDRLGR